MPDPLSETVAGELVALLTNETPPENVPVLAGEKFSVKVWLAEGANVNGKATPLRLNPVPVKLADETVTLEFPVFVISTASFAEDPTSTDPKETELGEAVSK